MPTDFEYIESHGTYGDLSDLQSYEAFVLPPLLDAGDRLPESSKYWIIFIHGGAWRDPSIDATSFVPTCKHLVTSPLYTNIIPYISGFASLNYRLSPHSDYPEELQQTTGTPQLELPTTPSSPVQHPDHLHDILTGIATLQSRFKFNDRYILVGHSCGATLALQTIMHLPESFSATMTTTTTTTNNDDDDDDDAIPARTQKQQRWQQAITATVRATPTPPAAILGVDGIYNIPALLTTYADQPVYHECIKGAFGDDIQNWARVSPALGQWSSDNDSSRPNVSVHVAKDGEKVDVREAGGAKAAPPAPAAWGSEGNTLMVLAHSDKDELVDYAQSEGMLKRIREIWGLATLQPTLRASHLLAASNNDNNDGGGNEYRSTAAAVAGMEQNQNGQQQVEQNLQQQQHRCRGNSVLVHLQTGHAEVWEQGWELARVVSLVIKGLIRLERGHQPFDEVTQM